jgi:maleate isomerase
MTPGGTHQPNFRAAIGMVTPSANLVVERVTTAILADFPDVSAHFSRTPVFGSVDPYPDDYDWDGMLGAARLLAHAGPDVIAWNGSKGAMLGFAADRAFCDRVTAETGIAATTSSVALQAALAAFGARRVALVTPYASAYQTKLIAGFAREGIDIVAEAHAGVADNLALAAVPDATIAAMARRVASAAPDAILTWCTNFPAAYAVHDLEQELGVPILDAVTLAVWHALRLVGAADARGRSWGRLFALEAGGP